MQCLPLYFIGTNEITYKFTSQTGNQHYFMTQMEKHTYEYKKDKLPDQNNKPYFWKTLYLHITFHRDMCISLMNDFQLI